MYAFANVHSLLLAGINADDDVPPDTQQYEWSLLPAKNRAHIPSRGRRELRIYRQLLRLVPSLEERLMESSEEELMSLANMVRAIAC